jgi:hypothetical protein
VKRPLIEKTFPPDAVEALKQAGFEVTTVSSSPERIRVLKHNCAALFERLPGPTGGREGSELKLAQAPGYVIRGEIGRLWDAGYQKFWLLGPVTPRQDPGQADEPFKEPRRPALAEHLRDLHRFSEELKASTTSRWAPPTTFPPTTASKAASPPPKASTDPWNRGLSKAYYQAGVKP